MPPSLGKLPSKPTKGERRSSSASGAGHWQEGGDNNNSVLQPVVAFDGGPSQQAPQRQVTPEGRTRTASAIHIRVLPPKELDGLNLKYIVESRSTSPTFDKRLSVVGRRYSHCVWLHCRLGTSTSFPAPLVAYPLE